MQELFNSSPHPGWPGLMNDYVQKCTTEETYNVHLDANNVKFLLWKCNFLIAVYKL